ncbi:MAG: CapA family protein [Victivallales bacterium]|nr:CapA family protein [bacterium]MDY5696221.1 CapA family protein [Victivallales bacterium]
MIAENGLLKFREPEGGTRFRMVIAGDVCPCREGEKIVAEGRSAGLFAKVAPFLNEADLRVVQWETPLCEPENPIPKSGPNLYALPSSAELAAAGGFEVALLANNHTGDYGPEMLLQTINVLNRRGIRTVGAGANLEEAEKPLTLTAGGEKIAIFNFCEHEFGTAQENMPGSAPQLPLRNLRAVAEAARSADRVVAALHGGHEYNPFPSPRIQELCRAFADAGASFVFNCHAHCPEGVEYRNGTPIVYCPGNFYFPIMDEGGLWRFGYLPKALFDRRGVYALEILPYAFDAEQIVPLEGETRNSFFRYLETLSEPLDDPARMKRLFEAWSSRHGFGYLARSLAHIPPGWEEHPSDRAVAKAMLGLRNLFSCEAHNDIVRCFLCLQEENRIDEAAKLFPYMEKLQNPEWA